MKFYPEITNCLEVWNINLVDTKKKEIEEVLESSYSFEKLESFDKFLEIYEWHEKTWCWKKRSLKEKEELYQNYIVVNYQEKIVWWFWLYDYENWKVLQCLFSDKKWVWKIILEKVKERDLVYAFSKKKEFFEKMWFEEVEWQKSESWASLYIYSKQKLANC